MKRDEAVQKLKELMPELRELGVRSLLVFGSVARDEATETSDIDLIAEFDLPHTFLQYMDTLLLLEDRLGIQVDLLEASAMKPRMIERTSKEALRVA